MYAVIAGIVFVAILFLLGIRIVRPTSRGLVERLGKYHRLAMPGFNWVIPELVNIVGDMAGVLPLGRTATSPRAYKAAGAADARAREPGGNGHESDPTLLFAGLRGQGSAPAARLAPPLAADGDLRAPASLRNPT